MKILRLTVLLLLCAWVSATGFAQERPKITQVKIEHIGPASVSDELVRANIRVKPGDPFLAAATDDDVRNLYATGFFYNVRVKADPAAGGIVLTYVVQGKPRLVQINFQGNVKYSSAKLGRKISSKAGDLWDERKLFTDEQEILKMYQKSGHPQTKVKYSYSIDEAAGRATATFEITESPKVKIVEVDFAGATAFTQRKLRGVVKTRKHWMFSWITGHGFLKDEELEDDRDRLTEFYHNEGYIDFEIKRSNRSTRRPARSWFASTCTRAGSIGSGPLSSPATSCSAPRRLLTASAPRTWPRAARSSPAPTGC